MTYTRVSTVFCFVLVALHTRLVKEQFALPAPQEIQYREKEIFIREDSGYIIYRKEKKIYSPAIFFNVGC